jgi:hypothetical protein
MYPQSTLPQQLALAFPTVNLCECGCGVAAPTARKTGKRRGACRATLWVCHVTGGAGCNIRRDIQR